MVWQTSNIFSQISPGDLTTAHANLEGISNCTKCHEIGEKVYNKNCLSCHKEIQSLIDSNSGYHASSEVKGKDCYSCHSEHHGRKFRIINFDPEKFDHTKAGYKLLDAHSRARCDDCHQSKNISNNDFKKRKGTYLGLTTDCNNCHEDFHQKTLGNDCASCHDIKKFRPAGRFDHNNARYKLTGLHINVDCSKCHRNEKRNGKDFQVFKDIPFANCNSCHKDFHNGKFGTDCQSCHQTSGFKKIKESGFNHNKTDFPLVGKHRLVNCNQCHKTDIKQKMPHQFCTDCHEDYHRGQFVVDNKVRECSDCHNEEGFKPSLFTIDRHNQIQFRLTGSHLAVPCESCHHKNSSQPWQFKSVGASCIDCHQNIHGTELIAKYLPDNKCESCHQTEKWSTINFDHKNTEFALLGKHSSVSCRKCHEKESGIGENKIIFASLENNCEVCHKDIHYGQFRESGVSDCARCHGFENWKAEKFNHNTTRFSLEGAHQKLECSKCHPAVQSGDAVFIKFKLEEFKCAACHK